MKRAFWIALVLAGCVAAAPGTSAQAPTGGNGADSEQKKPANESQKPAGTPPSPSANPFPEDTTSVPVMPTTTNVPVEPESNGDQGVRVAAPSEDSDPARSPDDPVPAASDESEGFSSSLKGLENVVPPPDTDEPGKKSKKEPTHQEAAGEDINVGKYYLSEKNWKAALSRFQSAMVLDPENPEVYWGLAEAERHLNDYTDARAYYEKLLEYDPDGPHGKEARKAMKDPQIANAQKPVGDHP